MPDLELPPDVPDDLRSAIELVQGDFRPQTILFVLAVSRMFVGRVRSKGLWISLMAGYELAHEGIHDEDMPAIELVEGEPTVAVRSSGRETLRITIRPPK